MRWHAAACLLSLICAATPSGVLAQTSSAFRDRIDALRIEPEPDPFETEKSADLARIAAEEDWLFAPAPGTGSLRVGIVLFTAPNCAECATAQADLVALCERLDIGMTVLNTDDGDHVSAVMRRLSLDLTPSYVTRKTLIRGQIPSFVLERYLSD